MKKNTILLAFVTMLAFTSCDDFFEPDYTGYIPEKDFYDNINSLRLGLSAAFNVVQSKSYELSEMIFGLCVSDDAWTHEDTSTGNLPDVLNFTFDTQNSYILTRYDTQYKGINKANQVIRNARKIPFAGTSEDYQEIREMYGQAKVLRALFYFNLVKSFGGVSIQPEEQNLQNLIVPRSSTQETYAYIEKDLRESILLLRKGRYQRSEAGQIGVGGGLGLLMKVLLYEASPGTDIPADVKEAKWKEALEIGKYFIEGNDLTMGELLKFDECYVESWNEMATRLCIGGDSLYTKNTVLKGSDVCNLHMLSDFDKIFRLEGEYCIESLIEINHYNFSGLASSIDEGYYLVNSYVHQDESGVVVSPSATKNIYNTMANDPRLMYSISGRIYNHYFEQEGTLSLKNHDRAEGYLFMKDFVFDSELPIEGRNYRMLRYAEVLLIYAEVLLENGEAEKAIDYVNKVRERARKLITTSENAIYNPVNTTQFANVAYLPYNLAREAILKEKRIEMAGEWDRWFEICRLGIAYERQQYLFNNPPTEQTGKTTYRGKYFKKGINEIYPIPYKEVYTSNGVIKQNFGY